LKLLGLDSPRLSLLCPHSHQGRRLGRYPRNTCRSSLCKVDCRMSVSDEDYFLFPPRVEEWSFHLFFCLEYELGGFQGFNHSPVSLNDSASTELYYTVRFNLDTIANLLEFLSIVEKCTVLLSDPSASAWSAHCEFCMFS